MILWFCKRGFSLVWGGHSDFYCFPFLGNRTNPSVFTLPLSPKSSSCETAQDAITESVWGGRACLSNYFLTWSLLFLQLYVLSKLYWCWFNFVRSVNIKEEKLKNTLFWDVVQTLFLLIIWLYITTWKVPRLEVLTFLNFKMCIF